MLSRMVTDFLERVRAALKTKGVTAVALAQRANLHRNTLSGLERDDWNPTAETLMKLEPHVAAIERGEWQAIPEADSEAKAAA